MNTLKRGMSLADYVGQSVNIGLSLDNDNMTGKFYINGEPVGEEISYNKKITKETEGDFKSKLTIGARSDGSSGFIGKMGKVEFKKGKSSSKQIKERFKKLSTTAGRKLFSMNFRNALERAESRFTGKGKGKLQLGLLHGGNDTINFKEDSTSDRVGLEINDSSMEFGVQNTGKLFENLSRNTFTGWIKLPSGYDKEVFQPIISKDNTFAFGVNNGHAALYLNHNGKITRSMAPYSEDVSSVGLTKRKLAEQSFNTDAKKGFQLVRGGERVQFNKYTPYGIGSTRSLKIEQNEKVLIKKAAFRGEDMSSFGISMWIKPDDLSGTCKLFERTDMGILLQSIDGKLKLTTKEIAMPKARYLRLQKTADGNSGIQLKEIRVIDENDNNIAPGAGVDADAYFENNPYFHPASAVDEDETTIYKSSTSKVDGSHYLELDFGEDKHVKKIELVNADENQNWLIGVDVILRTATGYTVGDSLSVLNTESDYYAYDYIQKTWSTSAQ